MLSLNIVNELILCLSVVSKCAVTYYLYLTKREESNRTELQKLLQHIQTLCILNS